MPRASRLELGLHPGLQEAWAGIYPTVEAYLISRELRSVPDDTDDAAFTRQAEQALLDHIRHHVAPQPVGGLALRLDVQLYSRILPSGCQSLDELLLGGVREGHLTEFAGDLATGKTQVCLQLAAATALRGEGVLFVDTHAAFSAARLAQLCQAQATNAGAADAALGCVRVQRCHDIHDLLALLQQLQGEAQPTQAQAGSTRLLLVDSLSALVSPVLGGQQARQGHALMVRAGATLKRAAARGCLAAVVTNHVVTDGAGASRPALGESWRVQPHARCLLTRQDGPPPRHRASLLASTMAAAGGAAFFAVTPEGLASLA